MKCLLDFDQEGNIVGRYIIDRGDGQIPTITAIEVDLDLFNRTSAETDGVWKRNVDGTITKQPPVITLADEQQKKLDHINAGFNTTISKGYMTSIGIMMDARAEDLQRLKIGYDFAELQGETKMSIVDFNNATHADLPLADVATLMTEVGENYRHLFFLKQKLREAVATATTPEQVAAVVWPSGG